MDFYDKLDELKSRLGLSNQKIGKIINKSSDATRMAIKRESLTTLEKVAILKKFGVKLTPELVLNASESSSGSPEMMRILSNNLSGEVREPDAHWAGHPNIMMVPMISHRAQAGFMAGWADESTTLEDYPQIPWEVDREYKGKYVCFEVTGDSMNDGTPDALLDGDSILCREVMQQHWQNKLHINQWDFVIAHKERGIVVKRITEHEVDTGRLVLHSLNDLYDDYEVYLQDCIALFNVVDVKRSRRR